MNKINNILIVFLIGLLPVIGSADTIIDDVNLKLGSEVVKPGDKGDSGTNGTNQSDGTKVNKSCDDMTGNLYVPEIIGNNNNTGELFVYSPNGYGYLRLSDTINRITYNTDLAFSTSFGDNSSTEEISDSYAEHVVRKTTNGDHNYTRTEWSILNDYIPYMKTAVREEYSGVAKLMEVYTSANDFDISYSNNGAPTSLLKVASSGISLGRIDGYGIPPENAAYYVCIVGQADGTGIIVSSAVPCPDY